MMCFDRSAMIFVGAATEVEVLKKALAEAEEKAAKEQAAREKHEARFDEVQQELQDVVKKYEALEGDCPCQNRRISGRGSRTMRLRRMVTGGRGHDVYLGSGPLDGGNTLCPA